MLPRHLGLVHTRYLFQVESDCDPFEASTVLKRGTLPPAVGAVDNVCDGMAVFQVSVVAHLFLSEKEEEEEEESYNIVVRSSVVT